MKSRLLGALALLLIAAWGVFVMWHRAGAEDGQKSSRATPRTTTAPSAAPERTTQAVEDAQIPPVARPPSKPAPRASKPQGLVAKRPVTRAVPPGMEIRRASTKKGAADYPELILASPTMLEELFEASEGEEIHLQLGSDFSFSGTVTMLATQPDGGPTVLGATDGHSRLNLQRERRGYYRGFITHERSRTAHTIETREDGALVVRQVPLDHVICVRPGMGIEQAGLPIPLTSEPAATQQIQSAAPPVFDSRPSATAVIYLDFDGHVVTATPWNSEFGISSINAAASTLSTQSMANVCAIVAEDFAPFDITVTTSLSRYNAAPGSRRIRVLITPTYQWLGEYGGVAYLGSFRWSGDTPCWVFDNLLSMNAKYIADATSHEVGHTLDLKHDGTLSPAREYYSGVNNSTVSWGPIMGASYAAEWSQWSKGDYASASNKEDDLAIITNTANGFGYRMDDLADTTATAPLIQMQSGSATQVNQTGIVEKNTDVDVVHFTATSGTVNLQIRPAALSPNLFLRARLLDSSGAALLDQTATRQNSTISLSRNISAGVHYVRVEKAGMPGGSNAVDTNGYGSMGEYVITGNIPAVAAPPVLNISQTTVAASVQQGQNAGSQTFTVNNAGGGTLNYSITESLSWLSVSPNSGSSTGNLVTHTINFTTSTLSPGNYSGTITVTATGVAGSPQTIDVNLTVAAVGTGATFANAAAITIPSSGSTGQATPYPSNLVVSGMGSSVTGVRVELRGLSHTYASDMDILLVAPNGQKIMLMSDAGESTSVTNATLRFTVDGTPLPEFSTLETGTYRPTDFTPSDTFPSPAPAGPYSINLAAALSGGVDGTWRLFVNDDFPSDDGGTMANGWALIFSTSNLPVAPAGVAATDGTLTDRVRVAWNAVSGATSYQVWRSTINDPAGAAQIASLSALAFDDITSVAGVTYYYWLKAVNASGPSPFSVSDSGWRGAVSGSNDLFANRALLNPGTVTVSSSGATKESGEPNHAGNGGGKSMWWSWTAPADGTLTISTTGSNFDTLLGLYSGTAVNALTTRASDDDSGGNLTSRITFSAVAGTTYHIAVDGFNGASGTIQLSLAFQNGGQPPSPVASVSATDGAFTDRVRITWTAAANAASYDVLRGTTTTLESAGVVGTTSSVTLDDLSAMAGQTYYYWVVAKNGTGSAAAGGPDAGSRATVAGGNDHFANRFHLFGRIDTATASNASATKESSEPNHAGNGGGKSLWWSWTAPASGSVTMGTIGSSFDTVLGIYQGTAVTSLALVASDDDSGGSLTSRTTFTAVAGQTYSIAVDGYNGASGTIILRVELSLPSPPAPVAIYGGSKRVKAGSTMWLSGSAFSDSSFRLHNRYVSVPLRTSNYVRLSVPKKLKGKSVRAYAISYAGTARAPFKTKVR